MKWKQVQFPCEWILDVIKWLMNWEFLPGRSAWKPLCQALPHKIGRNLIVRVKLTSSASEVTWDGSRQYDDWLLPGRVPQKGGGVSPEDFLLCTGIECGGGSFRRCVQYERPVRCLREDIWTWWGLPNLAVLPVYYMLHLYALCTGVFKCVSFYFTHAAPLAYVVYSWNTFKLPNFLFILSLFWVRCGPMTIQHFVWLETAYPAYLKVVIHKGRYYHIFTWWIHREKRFQHSRSYEGSTNYP